MNTDEEPIAKRRQMTKKRKAIWLARQSQESLDRIRSADATAYRRRIEAEINVKFFSRIYIYLNVSNLTGNLSNEETGTIYLAERSHNTWKQEEMDKVSGKLHNSDMGFNVKTLPNAPVPDAIAATEPSWMGMGQVLLMTVRPFNIYSIDVPIGNSHMGQRQDCLASIIVDSGIALADRLHKPWFDNTIGGNDHLNHYAFGMRQRG
ncbi:hypothetical protein AVEN_104610-1 [Araneus ventricosus]|uniref:Uncharacterized protein n=1 Tax=Araneus ventricosus TaxID=182803 RepID=A0A4Y2BBG8_ARAVE|nr:hypothetical protein AVEN_104610-1 [Araneus ventricosus]